VGKTRHYFILSDPLVHIGHLHQMEMHIQKMEFENVEFMYLKLMVVLVVFQNGHGVMLIMDFLYVVLKILMNQK
jgi:hypothetical protein